MSKKFLSTGEVAKILGISRVAVFKKIKSGKIAAEKFGGRYLIEPHQLGLFYKTLDTKTKTKIKVTVQKIFDEYGDVIKKLGNE